MVAIPKAKLAYERCLKIDPDHPVALSGLGAIAVTYEWNLQKAESLLDRALKRAPHDAHVNTSYGNYYMAIGNTKKLVELTFQGIESDPKARFIHQMFGVSSYFNGDMEIAEKHNLIALHSAQRFSGPSMKGRSSC